MKKGRITDVNFHPLKKHLHMGFIRLHILLEIKKGETYGYDLMKRIVEHIRCHAKESPAKKAWIDKIGPGEIYSVLDSLETQGYIKSNWILSGKKPKKKYVITKKGEKSLTQAKAIFIEAIKNFKALFSEM